MERETKTFPFDLKAVGDDGTFDGWLSTFGNEDLGGDIVEPGAFTKTLAERKGPVPILWMHDEHQPIGVFSHVEQKADGGPTGMGGLAVKGALNLDVQKGKEAHALMKQKALGGLSIGYSAVKTGFKDATRLLKEVKLFEGSLVTFPMNEAAAYANVKEAGAGDFPLAPRDTAWDAPAAIMRLREHLDATKKPNAAYARCFFFHDSAQADSFGSYHMPFCDVISGKVEAVPHAIFAAAADLMGGHGQHPAYADNASVRALVGRYYQKMRSEFLDESIHAPWEQDHTAKAAELDEFTAAIAELRKSLQEPGSPTHAGADVGTDAFLAAVRDMRAEVARSMA